MRIYLWCVSSIVVWVIKWICPLVSMTSLTSSLVFLDSSHKADPQKGVEQPPSDLDGSITLREVGSSHLELDLFGPWIKVEKRCPIGRRHSQANADRNRSE